MATRVRRLISLLSRSRPFVFRVELAPLPRYPSHHGLTGSPEPGVIVTDDELYAVHAASLQAFEELPPVRLGLGELHTAAARLTCVEVTSSPHNFLDDGRHLPGADALHVHLGHGKDHRPLATNTPAECLRIEGPAVRVPVVPSLRDPQFDQADAGVQRLGLKTVGVALTIDSLRDSALSTCSHSICMAWFMRAAKAAAMASGPCSIARSTRSRITEHSSWWVIAGSLEDVKYFQESLDGPPFQLTPAIYRNNVGLTAGLQDAIAMRLRTCR